LGGRDGGRGEEFEMLGWGCGSAHLIRFFCGGDGSAWEGDREQQMSEEC